MPAHPTTSHFDIAGRRVWDAGSIRPVSEVTGLACGACGAVAPAGARFCAACGQPLVTRADERRIVTVLFADLVGFTTMAERSRPRAGQEPGRPVLRAPGRRRRRLRRPGRQGRRRRHPRALRRPDRPRGRRRARRAGRAAHAADAGDVGRGRRGRRACGCGSGSTPARCSSAACGPAATGPRWATSSTPPAGCRPWPSPGTVVVGADTHAATDGGRALHPARRARRQGPRRAGRGLGGRGGRRPARPPHPPPRRADGRPRPRSATCSTA